MTVMLIVIGFVIAFITIYLVIQNRGSEKILNSFFSALIIGFSGAFLSIFFSLKTETKTGKFSTLLFFIEEPKSLFNIDYYIADSEHFNNNPFSSIFYDEVNRIIKEESKEIKNDLLVEQILEKKIFEIIGHNFDKFWLRDILIVESPTGYFNLQKPIEREIASKRIDWVDLKNIFPSNPFINKKTMRPIITLPPLTKISSIKDNGKSQIIIKTDFVVIKISYYSSFSEGGNGFGKKINQLASSDKNIKTTKTKTVPILIDYKIEFNGLKIGHPEMSKQKKWANDIINSLINSLDSKLLWESVHKSTNILEIGEKTKPTHIIR